jgi:hypothetical protein
VENEELASGACASGSHEGVPAPGPTSALRVVPGVEPEGSSGLDRDAFTVHRGAPTRPAPDLAIGS